MSNSSLVNYTNLSPNHNNGRNHIIDKITLHHMAGNITIETCGNMFANPARECSSNYGIGTDGRIGLYCNEEDRSWCSSSPSNDNRAITIEIANDGRAPDWHISDKALASTIELCVDICKRNNIPKLNFTGDVNGNLTMHCYFAATACPGPYLKSKFGYIADKVNKRLNSNPTPAPVTPPVAPPAPAKSSLKTVATKVYQGLYGNGEDRRRKLEAEGYNYAEVQNKVAEMFYGKAPSAPAPQPAPQPTMKSIDVIAREVIHGDWGNGADRIKRLTKAGYDADAVRIRVNQIL